MTIHTCRHKESFSHLGSEEMAHFMNILGENINSQYLFGELPVLRAVISSAAPSLNHYPHCDECFVM